jgi:GGDEF domain-containing protein
MPALKRRDSARKSSSGGRPNLQVVDHGQTLGTITVSIGVAAFPDHGTTAQELLGAADKALYRAEAGGRNLVIAASSSCEVEWNGAATG